jgi:hypothetical protein
MTMSSFNALNKVEAGMMTELNDYIAGRLEGSITSSAGNEKPCGLHFVVDAKIFKGTNQPFVSCPIQFLLRDQGPETLLCQPVWTDPSQRCHVNRKARLGVKMHSVIRLDDYSVVIDKRSRSGYLFFIRKYLVVKKTIDDDAYERWRTE